MAWVRGFQLCLLAAVVMAIAPAVGGCSLLGAGIGSAVPRYEALERERGLHIGEELRVVVFNRPEGNDPLPHGRGESFDGRYAGVHGGFLSLTVDDRVEPREIALTDIAEIRVREGSHWATGLIVGGFLDATIVVLAVVAATQTNEMSIHAGSFR